MEDRSCFACRLLKKQKLEHGNTRGRGAYRLESVDAFMSKEGGWARHLSQAQGSHACATQARPEAGTSSPARPWP